MVSFLDLPSELLAYIHLLACNPSLPLTHPVTYSSLSALPLAFKARYLLALYGKDIDRSLRYPICTIEVLDEMERMAGPLHCKELPRRLFRSLSGMDPLVDRLFSCYTPFVDSHKGYPLCRAVLKRNYTLVEYLLTRGADPGMRSHLAVQVAIQMRDLRTVRLLLQGRTVEPAFVEWALKYKDERVVQYLMSERGMMPRLGSILAIKAPKRHADKTQTVQRLVRASKKRCTS